MKRLFGGLSVALLLAVSLAVWAGDPEHDTSAQESCQTVLPLSAVVLYSSGVGYFQRDGSVEGRGHLELRFKVDNIERVHAKHPLNGFRLKNSTPLHLMQGPITVFDGGTYAGDARIEDLPPGQERLISYAIDPKTEVEPLAKPGQQQLVSVSMRKGTLCATVSTRQLPSAADSNNASTRSLRSKRASVRIWLG
jgi:hypothetical protein